MKNLEVYFGLLPPAEPVVNEAQTRGISVLAEGGYADPGCGFDRFLR